MSESKKSYGIWSIALFIIVALAGIGLTVWLADGNTVKGIIGGVVTVALAWFAASKAENIFSKVS